MTTAYLADKSRALSDRLNETICEHDADTIVDAILMALLNVTAFTLSRMKCPICRREAAHDFARKLLSNLDHIEGMAAVSAAAHDAPDWVCWWHKQKMQ
jgi:hypothetical protein